MMSSDYHVLKANKMILPMCFEGTQSMEVVDVLMFTHRFDLPGGLRSDGTTHSTSCSGSPCLSCSCHESLPLSCHAV